MTGALEPHRRMLWAVAWRMLGDPEEAGDVVQETFLRALDRPPADTQRPWGGWLLRVATNLARDRLRLRRRRGWEGPWLPAPLEVERVADPEVDPERQAALRETAAYAWLVAAESLTPTQRAVLLLREVAGLDVAETADALGLTAGNVKVHHHRARRALGTVGPATGDPEEAAAALLRFLLAVSAGDREAARACLAPDVRVLSDGGGRYHAARVPVVGADKVAGMYLQLAKWGAPDRLRLMQVPGGGGLVAEHDHPAAGQAPRWVQLARLGPDGKIAALWSVLAPEKVRGVAVHAEPAL
jgi:RNA polymerase sigma-70 factor (ECF subfamily)